MVFVLAIAPKAGADVLAFRQLKLGQDVSVCFKTSYISFLLQQNVYVPSLTDPLTEQLLEIGSLAQDPVNVGSFAGRIIEISYDPTIQRARIRVTPIDHFGPVVTTGMPFKIEVPFDPSKRMFLPPLMAAQDN